MKMVEFQPLDYFLFICVLQPFQEYFTYTERQLLSRGGQELEELCPHNFMYAM